MGKIEKLINEHARRAGNLCGITAVKLAALSGIPAPKVGQLMLDLETVGKIKIREGINSKLAFAL